MPMTNANGYRHNNCIVLRECRHLLRHYISNDVQMALDLFESITEICRLTPGADGIVVPHIDEGYRDQQKLALMFDYLSDVFDVVDELEWGRVNQVKYKLAEADLTNISVQSFETAKTVDNTQDSTHGEVVGNVSNSGNVSMGSGNVEPTHDTVNIQQGFGNPKETNTPIGPPPGLEYGNDVQQSGNKGVCVTPMAHGTGYSNDSGAHDATGYGNVTYGNVSHVNTQNVGIHLLIEQQRQQQKDMAQLQLFSQVYDKLDGKDGAKYETWSEGVKKRLLLTQADEQTALSHIRTCLTGNALRMYESAGDNIRLSLPETWRFLENRFGDQRCAAVRHSTFYSCDQRPNESIRQYVSELESRCFLNRETYGFDTVMMQRLSHGLISPKHKEMAIESLLKEGENRLDDLVKSVEVNENSAKIQKCLMMSTEGHATKKHEAFHPDGVKPVYGIFNSRIPDRQYSHRWCRNCNNTSHYINKCWYAGNAAKCMKYGYGSRAKTKYKQTEYAEQQQIKQYDRDKFRKCYRCGNKGHIAMNCPVNEKQVECYDHDDQVMSIMNSKQTVDKIPSNGYLKHHPNNFRVDKKKNAKVKYKNLKTKKKSAPYIRVNSVKVKHNEYSMDSGANTNLISSIFAKSLGVKVYKCDDQISTFNGSKIFSNLACTVNVSIKGGRDFIECNIVDDMKYRILIGFETMERLGIYMMGPNGVRYVGNNSYSDRGSEVMCAVRTKACEDQGDILL